MMYRALSFVNSFVTATRYLGYGEDWRFSDARLVQAATSDRVCLGGKSVTRCHLNSES